MVAYHIDFIFKRLSKITYLHYGGGITDNDETAINETVAIFTEVMEKVKESESNFLIKLCTCKLNRRTWTIKSAQLSQDKNVLFDLVL